MEALGAAASVIAVVELAGKVWSITWQYYAEAKNAESDIKRLMNNISAVQEVFQRIERLVNGPDASKWAASKELIERISSELKVEFERLLRDLGAAQMQMIPEKKRKFEFVWRFRKLKWPLQKEDVERAIRLMEQHKTTLITAISCDQM